MDPSTSTNLTIGYPTGIPTASGNYMALLMSRQGVFVEDYRALRSMVIHLEPTLSFAIAYAGYTQTHKITHQALEAAWARVKARHEDLKLYDAALVADKQGIHRDMWRETRKEARKLKSDSGALGELVLKARRAVVRNLDGKGRGGIFEMDVHMGAVEMVGIRWELEESGI
jgi:hypothetical protein